MARATDPYAIEQDPYARVPSAQQVPAAAPPPVYTSPGMPVNDPLAEAITASYAQPGADPSTSGLYGPDPVSPTTPAAPTVPTTPTYNTASWNTGGYATPGYVASNVQEYALPGWEQTNWADQNMMTPKYVVGKILSQYPASPNGLKSALADIQRAYPGTQLQGKDTLVIPGVGTIDVGQAFDDTKPDQTTSWWWGALADQNGVPYQTGAVPGIATPGSSGTGGGAGANGWDPSMRDAITSKLLAFLNEDPSNVSVTDSDISPVAQTHDKALQRARRLAQSQLAEQAAADGTLGTGGFDADVQKTYSDYADKQAGFEAGLVNTKMKERRAQILQALQLGAGLLDAQTERGLRLELAQIDDATRRYGLNLSNSQFYDNLGLDQAKFESVMNNNIINSLLSGWNL